jgi:hypothetical protein
MPSTRKKKHTGKKQTVKTHQKQKPKVKKEDTENELFVKALIVGKKYTEKLDKDFEKYKDKKEFKRFIQSNPTLYIVNMIYIDCIKKSLFTELCESKNKELVNVLIYCFKLATIIKTKANVEKYPVISQLCKNGFNTIYDIVLENPDSFFLVSFVSHLVSEGIIKNANDFIISLVKNKTYDNLRNPLVIRGLQLANLFTRIKRYQ